MIKQNLGKNKEAELLREISTRLRGIRALLLLADLDKKTSAPASAFALLWELKTIQGNLSINLSALACLAVNDYLVDRFGPLQWNPLLKAQGAPGRDVDLMLRNGERLIGEIKTTKPYKANDFGAQQKSSIKADLVKLRSDSARHKFLFLTDHLSHSILKRWPEDLIGGLEIVLLGAEASEDTREDTVKRNSVGRADITEEIEFVKAGQISSADERIEFLRELASAYELAGIAGLAESAYSA